MQPVVDDADLGQPEPLPGVYDLDEPVRRHPLGHPEVAHGLRVQGAVAAQQDGQVAVEERVGGERALQLLVRDLEDLEDLVEEGGVDLGVVAVAHLVPEVGGDLHLRRTRRADLHHRQQVVEAAVDHGLLHHVVAQVGLGGPVADELVVVGVLVHPVLTGGLLQPGEVGPRFGGGLLQQPRLDQPVLRLGGRGLQLPADLVDDDRALGGLLVGEFGVQPVDPVQQELLGVQGLLVACGRGLVDRGHPAEQGGASVAREL